MLSTTCPSPESPRRIDSGRLALSNSQCRPRVESRWGSPATTDSGCSFRQTDPIPTGFLPTTHLNSRIQTGNRPAHDSLVSSTSLE